MLSFSVNRTPLALIGRGLHLYLVYAGILILGGIHMSELEEIIKQIEELRLSTIKVQDDKSNTNPEVVAACHELHANLDRYQGMLMRIEEDK